MPSSSSISSPSISQAEREVLVLLAEGHTAKSIAAELDLSVHAVNERLREARRKTGASSSRDLARRLAAQENWDKQIGVPGDDPPDAEPKTSGAAMMVCRRSRILIIMFATIVVSALAIVGVQRTSEPPDVPSQVSSAPAEREIGVPGSAASLDPYRARFVAEARDSDWAAPAELRALAFFTLVDGIRSIDVDCAATLCRVDGEVVPGKMSRARAEVQGDTLRDRLGGIGLEVTAAAFRKAPDAAGAGSFTAFLRRDG